MTDEFKTDIVTEEVTGWFIHVIEPAPNLQKEMKYSAQVVIDKDRNKKTLKLCKDAIKSAGLEGVDKNTFPKTALKSLLQPLRDGDAEIADETKKRGAEYTNKIFFNANSNKPPDVVDRFNQDILDDDECYSGALYRFNINFYASNKGSNRICAGLANVMKVGDGKRMDGKQSATKAFEGMFEESPEGDGPADLEGGAFE